MSLESFVFRFLRDNFCFIEQGTIYALLNGGKDFAFNNARFAIKKIGKMNLLEQSFLENYEKDIAEPFLTKAKSIEFRFRQKFGKNAENFIDIAQILLCNEKRSEGYCIDEFLGDNAFFNCLGLLYPLYKAVSSELIINGNYYCISGFPELTAEKLESMYMAKLKEKIAQKVLDNGRAKIVSMLEQGYYDRNKDVGLKVIGDSLFLYTSIPPFVLFERKNSCYYLFPKAEAGASVSVAKGKIIFGSLRVLNAYKHPALQYINKEMQPICLGEFSADALNNLLIAEKAMLLMRKARKALCSEYRSQGKPYHFLTEECFNDLIAKNPDKRLITNVD